MHTSVNQIKKKKLQPKPGRDLGLVPLCGLDLGAIAATDGTLIGSAARCGHSL